MVAVVGAVVLALAGLHVDERIDGATELPLGLASTVDSARAVLSTVASATITFAGIAFSVSLLVVQQAASQHSPRIVQTLFRDPFNRRVMALVVGTFTYCLIVLRSVRASLDPAGEPIVPSLSVGVAVVLGVATILAVVAFINHSAHTMNVSEILERALRDAVAEIPVGSATTGGRQASDFVEPLGDEAWLVRFDRSGWVQHIDREALLGCLPDGAILHIRSHPGRYAVTGTVMCASSVVPSDPDEVARSIRRAVTIGTTRTPSQDPTYGVRALADVALRALSPGINDPTTAQDAIFHLAAVLVEFVNAEPPNPISIGRDGRRLVMVEQPSDEEVIRLAFDEIRRAAAAYPTVCIYLLEALALIDEARGTGEVDAVGVALRQQARLVVEGCAAADVLPADLELVRAAFNTRFAQS
jgi:uncharacterized membrane protein